MSDAQNRPARSSRRRYILLLTVIILVVAGWSAAWLFGRSVLADQMDLQMKNLARRGLDLSCTNLAITGFPFRYEVSCSEARSEDVSGFGGSLQRLNAVALVYNPRHVIFEARSPAVLTGPGGGFAGDVDWDTARASLKVSGNALTALDAVVENPEGTFENVFSAVRFTAGKAELHLRPAGEAGDALETFLSVEALELPSVTGLQVPVDFRGHAEVAGGTALLSGADLVTLVRLNDGMLPVRLKMVEASLGKSRVSASGDLVVNGDGTLSGEVDLALGNAEALLQALAPLFPPRDNTFALLQTVAGSMAASAVEVDGAPTISMSMVLDRGIARVGFLTLGQIPPLFQAGS